MAWIICIDAYTDSRKENGLNFFPKTKKRKNIITRSLDKWIYKVKTEKKTEASERSAGQSSAAVMHIIVSDAATYVRNYESERNW